MNKLIKIFLNTIPVILMIALIPFVRSDYWLVFAYVAIILISFLIKREEKDFLFLIFGFLAMAVSEYFFVSTGVEIFLRDSLFGLMPVWLPVLWAYAFVVIKRSIDILR